MKKGDKVIVRAFGDERLVRRVWDINEKHVFICSEENFKLLQDNNRKGFSPVGFSRKDVFKFFPDYKKKQWHELTQYE